MIHWLPLEPLEQRYTSQMDRWVQAALERTGQVWRTVYGETSRDRIGHGEWLDTTATAAWKTEQLLAMTQDIESGAVRSGDVILVGDVWFPGIETLKFQCDLLGKKVRFAGWHYAGCFDPHDLLSRELGSWGRKFEAMLLEGVFDAVCFGSQFHRGFVERNITPIGKAVAAGLAWNHDEVAAYKATSKQPRVVFNHRWSNEKRWQEFVWLADTLRPNNRGWTWEFSTSGNVNNVVQGICDRAGIRVVQHASKDAYYRYLAESGVVWSGADQETFGYSFMEAIALGVPVVAPNRVAYRDHLINAGLTAGDWLYSAYDPCGAVALQQQMRAPRLIPERVSSQYAGSVDVFLKEVLDDH